MHHLLKKIVVKINAYAFSSAFIFHSCHYFFMQDFAWFKKLHENVADEKHKYLLKLIWGRRKHSMDPIWRCFLFCITVVNMILTSVSLIYFLLLFDCFKKLKRNRKEVMRLSFKYV